MKEKMIYVDVGSSTVKIYELSQGVLSLIKSKSIPSKNEFDVEKGLSENCKHQLFDLFEEIKNKNGKVTVKIFATAIFRKMTPEAKKKFVDEFFKKTGYFFNIIDQDLENFYLEVAMTGKCTLEDPILLINIGGGSTELVVLKNKEVIERLNLDFGVGSVLSEFKNINLPLSGVTKDEVKGWLRSKLPELKTQVKVAFYTGGELTYMKLAKYNLRPNHLFKDSSHPSTISIGDLKTRNSEVYKKVSLEELEKLMPENPTWMHGARACGAVAEAICDKSGIETIIPSDANLIDGAARQEFRTVTISGSFRKHLQYILDIKKRLEDKSVTVLSPRFIEPKNPGDEFVVFQGEEGESPLDSERFHLNSIANSDALIVCDPEGYVGASALIEIGHAYMLGKKVVFCEEPVEFMLNTIPREVGF